MLHCLPRRPLIPLLLLLPTPALRFLLEVASQMRRVLLGLHTC